MTTYQKRCQSTQEGWMTRAEERCVPLRNGTTQCTMEAIHVPRYLVTCEHVAVDVKVEPAWR